MGKIRCFNVAKFSLEETPVIGDSASARHQSHLPQSLRDHVLRMEAEIIAVGSELLTSQRLDTNSLFITDQLNALGVEVRRKIVVGDDHALLTASIREAIERVEIIILNGGLGPTEDD